MPLTLKALNSTIHISYLFLYSNVIILFHYILHYFFIFYFLLYYFSIFIFGSLEGYNSHEVMFY